MLKIKPPANNAAAEAKWIPTMDPAWDHERATSEYKVLGDRLLEHPINVYYSGATRFDLDAVITIPEPIRSEGGPSAAPVGAWLTEDPTVFTLRVLGALDWELAMADTDKMYWELCRRGVQDVCNIVGLDGEPLSKLPRDADGMTSRAWLDMLSKHSRRLITALGEAIYNLNLRREASAEGKL